MSCHRPGGSAPFSLVKYDEARPWAKAIQEEVLSRRMPPWGAVKGFGEFANDRGLTQEEVSIIADWAEGGAPEGDPNLVPELPRAGKLAPPPAGAGLSVSSRWVASAQRRLVAITAEGPARVVARLPGGAAEPVLWVPLAQKAATTYVLAESLVLPPGARVETTGRVRLHLR